MGLVTVQGDNVRFSETVSRVAKTLRPLGPLGQYIAESYALNTEMRRVESESPRRKEIVLALLDQRRQESSATLRHARKHLGGVEKNAVAMRECLLEMQRKAVKPGLALEERQMYIGLTERLTTLLVEQHKELGDDVTAVVDKVLNGGGARNVASAAGVERRRGQGRRRQG